MNQEETLALWKQGKEAWNAWAKKILAERKALEDEGEWDVTVMPWGEEIPVNETTKNWFKDACAVFSSEETPNIFPDATYFYGFLFPSLSKWSAATFENDTGFSGATFEGVARFNDTTFEGDAEFDSVTFVGVAGFGRTIFESNARFDSATFKGDARFDDTTFKGAARFGCVTFEGGTGFDGATFEDNVEFFDATFESGAWIGRATFKGNAGFDSATFKDDARFDDATFVGDARFSGTTFKGSAGFDSATFEGRAGFVSVTFVGGAGFGRAIFKRGAKFNDVNFEGGAEFDSATFEGGAGFDSATFVGEAGFNSVCFEKPTCFSGARFNSNTSFNSSQIRQAFDLSGARFKEVPDFRQTHCDEAPLLDDVHIDSTIIKQRKSSQEPDFTVTANYRALKRLAIQGHDHRHEVEFFAEELRAQRIMVHRFLGWDWWLSFLFAATSDYGRSILRPIAWWVPVMLISALSYLLSAIPTKVPKSLGDAIYQSVVSWYHGIQLVIPTRFHISWLPDATEFQQAMCKGGSVVAAAYNLAASKGLIIPGIADRTLIIQAYECLYDGNVPFGISWIMGIQTALSAALLFLLLLGIRNRFKLK